MVRLIRNCLWLFAFIVSTVAARPLSLLPADAVFIDDPPSQTLSKQSAVAVASAQAAVSSGRDAEAIAVLRSIEAPLEFELAALVVITRLQAGEDSPSSRALLVELSEAPVRVFTRHEETAANWFVPVFDIGERALSALRMFDERQLVHAWKHQLEVDPDAAAIAMLKGSSDGSTVAAAVALLDSASATRLSERLLATKQVQTPSGVARELALQTADRRWFDHVAQWGAASDQLILISQTQKLASDEASSWLVAASAHPELGSAALLALAAYADVGSLALARLVDALDDQRLGPSAAMALAKRAQADRLEVLTDLTQRKDLSSRALGRVALSLRLEGSQAARELLDVLSLRSDLPPSVREELSR